MFSRIRTWLLPWTLIGMSVASSMASADAASVALALEAELNTLEPAKPELRGLPIAWPGLLPRFYAQRGFRPAWDRAEIVDQLLAAIRASHEDGLTPEDYYLTPLTALVQELRREPVGDEAQAELDVLCTEALLRLSYHLAFGKVDASAFDAQWNYGRVLPPEDKLVAIVEGMVEATDLRARVEGLKPTHYLYVTLKQELSRYRDIAARGGWRSLPGGPPLKEGMTDARVAPLRTRLALTGEVAAATDQPDVFDPALTAAVHAYQTRLGLPVTGVVDAAMMAELNVPVATRIDQMRVNLDRGRALLQDLPDAFVVVNVAAFDAFVVRAGKVVWRARVQVGKPLRRTPIFRAELSYLVLNPTWTVPPSILAQDILPEAHKSAKAITRRHLKVYDRNGRELNPSQIAWSKFRNGTTPYTLRQDAGPRNALGRVKLMFPNRYSVYMHDTPAQELFEAGERNFSSGCVRVERALELAQLLLDDPVKWGEAKIGQVVASQRTTHVSLPTKLPILLSYWTAWADDQHRVHFRRDAYGRDAQWLKQLSGGFVLPKRTLLAMSAK